MTGARRALRPRLTAVIAITVAVAIASAALGCWFIVQSQLMRQIDESLRHSPPPKDLDLAAIVQSCGRPPPPDAWSRDFVKPVQFVKSDGTPCRAGQAGVRVTEADTDVARTPRSFVLRDGVTEDGTSVRVMTRNVADDLAVSEWRGYDDVTATLRVVAFLLAGVAVLGVAVAATAGTVIAHTTLRPIERLTAAAEHIAQTEDLRVRIPVRGEDEIARLSRSFNAMTAALAASRERQGRLIADAGHELRTPLTSLRTNVDLLLRSEATGRDLEPSARHRLLVNVKAQLAELSGLVGDLLQLSRPAQGADAAEAVAFHEVVAAALERARLRGERLRFDVELREWYVHGDEASLERAVVNLLDNAVKFSPPGGTVTVRLAPTGAGTAEFVVRDQGPGIPEEDLPYVFERFWRSPAARGMPGSGLGLAIVAQAVRDAGGEVTLANAPGGGTLARVRLPGGEAVPAGG